MKDIRSMMRVPVGLLCKGLYVSQPDRPWTEIPLMFQGLYIRTDEEIEILRSHCSVVYVDTDRSSGSAIEQVRRDTAPAATAEPSAPADRPGGARDVFGESRHPDGRQFRALLHRTYERRQRVRDFVDHVLGDAKQGRGLDLGAADELIDGLVDVIGDNASAALWLANMKSRDRYTTFHSVNVCLLSLAFAVHLGYESGDLQRIGLGALLHDIGKVRTPPAILDKAGPLTDAEFDIVKLHPQDGHDIAVEAGGFPGQALEIILLHHERLDGTGYPHGLPGTRIPLHVRIVGLVDAYEAMTSPRSFRDAIPADKALQTLYNEADDRFGARVVQEFIRCVGVYPVGSLVELDNGALAVVLASRPDARVHPTVLLVRTPDGDLYEKRLLVNLAADDQSPAAPRSIRRVVNPLIEDIDVAGIIAVEFGLDMT